MHKHTKVTWFGIVGGRASICRQPTQTQKARNSANQCTAVLPAAGSSFWFQLMTDTKKSGRPNEAHLLKMSRTVRNINIPLSARHWQHLFITFLNEDLIQTINKQNVSSFNYLCCCLVFLSCWFFYHISTTEGWDFVLSGDNSALVSISLNYPTS